MTLKDRLRIISRGLSLEDDYPWNPYKGWTVQAVIDHAPKQVEWAMSKGLQLNNEAFQYYQNCLEE